MDRVLLVSGVMIVSRNDIEPSGCVSTTMQLMVLAMEFVLQEVFLM